MKLIDSIFPKVTSDSIARWFVIVPALHIAFTALNISAYASGFGASLLSIMTFDDLIIFSSYDMIKVYIFCAVFILSFRFYFWIIDKTSDRQSGDDIEIESSKSPKYFIPEKGVVRFLLVNVVIGWLLLLFLVIYMYFSDYIIRSQWVAFLIIVPIYSVVLNLIYTKKSIILIRHFIVVFPLSFVFIFSLAIGFDEGQLDRYLPYNSQRFQDNITCGNKKIIRRLSSYLLTIDSNNSRSLISDNCTIIFSIPARARKHI